MTAVIVDVARDDEYRRRRLYDGDLFIYTPGRAALALCGLARQMLSEAFAPWKPEEAQHHLPVEEYAAILADLKPRFIHHPDAKQHISDLLVEYGCDLDRTYFDVPRLRTSTSDGYLTTGIAYAFHPHRDTWYSAPQSQINWWIPVSDLSPDDGLAFHPYYWAHPLRNGSRGYNYDEWNRTSRYNAARHIGKDTRRQPKPEEPLRVEVETRPVCKPGGIILFSGAQLHSSVPNATGRTRLSIDFRTVHIDDARARRGAPNVDSECTGTNLRDFLRASDYERMPEAIARLHDGGPPEAEAGARASRRG